MTATTTHSGSFLSPTAATPERALRTESEAVYAALSAGVLGGLFGFFLALIRPYLPLADGAWAFNTSAAVGAAITAAASALVAYRRSRRLPGHAWRDELSRGKSVLDTISVVTVHTVLTALATLSVYLILDRGFIGVSIGSFWAIVLMALTLGIAAYIAYLSASRMSTERMTSMLLTFIVVGTLTAMVTTPDPKWWTLHFSQLGTFWDLSSFVFNGTLIAAGLLVTSFALSLSQDMKALITAGRLERAASGRFAPTLFAIMGIMLAGVGLFPVNVIMILHNLAASGMALMFLVLLIGGLWMFRGMPRAYFLSAWAFIVAMVGSVVLFATGYFTLTAFEIIVFALIFGWMAVFIRFLGVTGQPEEAVA